MRIFTLGHSTRSWEDFLLLLREFGIEVVADVRRHPSSRNFPHFNQGEMREKLAQHGMEYIWMESFGGRRRAGVNQKSPNVGLHSIGFRNYADHMMTGEFRAAVEMLVQAARQKTTVLLCAERLSFRCHRMLISDYLLSLGMQVVHIEDTARTRMHRQTPCAVLCDGGGVIYPERRIDNDVQTLEISSRQGCFHLENASLPASN